MVSWYADGGVSGFALDANNNPNPLVPSAEVTKLTVAGSVDTQSITRIQYQVTGSVDGQALRNGLQVTARIRFNAQDHTLAVGSKRLGIALVIAEAALFPPGHVPTPATIAGVGQVSRFGIGLDQYQAPTDWEVSTVVSTLLPNRKYWVLVYPTLFNRDTQPSSVNDQPLVPTASDSINTMGRAVSIWTNRTPLAPTITSPVSGSKYVAGSEFTLAYTVNDPDKAGSNPDTQSSDHAGVHVQYAPKPTVDNPTPVWIDLPIATYTAGNPIPAAGWHIKGSKHNVPFLDSQSGAFYFYALGSMKVLCDNTKTGPGQGIMPTGDWQIRVRTFDYGHPFPRYLRPLNSQTGDYTADTFPEANTSPWSAPVMVSIPSQVPTPRPISPVDNHAVPDDRDPVLVWQYRNAHTQNYAQARREVQVRKVGETDWTLVTDSSTASTSVTLSADAPSDPRPAPRQALADGGFENAINGQAAGALTSIRIGAQGLTGWSASATASGVPTARGVSQAGSGAGTTIGATGQPHLRITYVLPNSDTTSFATDKTLVVDYTTTSSDPTGVGAGLLTPTGQRVALTRLSVSGPSGGNVYTARFRVPDSITVARGMDLTVVTGTTFNPASVGAAVRSFARQRDAVVTQADGWEVEANYGILGVTSDLASAHSGNKAIFTSGPTVGTDGSIAPRRYVPLLTSERSLDFTGWVYCGNNTAEMKVLVYWMDAAQLPLSLDTITLTKPAGGDTWQFFSMLGLRRPAGATQVLLGFVPVVPGGSTTVTSGGDRFDDLSVIMRSPGTIPYPVTSGTQYEWRVRVTDASPPTGVTSNWSSIARFWVVPAASNGVRPVLGANIIEGATLGVGQHTVEVHRRGNKGRVGILRNVSYVDWGRMRDDMSTAKAVVTGWTREEGQFLARLHSWAYELVIWRDNGFSKDRVWEGPITLITYEENTVTFNAKDVLAYSYRRIIRQALNDSKGDTVTSRAARILQNAYAPDDPDVLAHLQVISSPSDKVQYRKTPAYSRMAFEEVDDMAQNSGLDYTAVGRAILLWGTKHRIGTLPEFRDKDLGAVPIVSEYGMSAANSYTVSDGNGVWGSADRLPVAVPGQTVDNPYGLIEMLSSTWAEDTPEDSGTYTQEGLEKIRKSFADSAERSVSQKWPIPVVVRVPDNTSLSPSLVVSIQHLVPGVVIPLRSTKTLRHVAANQKLDSIKVVETDKTEVITVVMSPFNREDNENVETDE